MKLKTFTGRTMAEALVQVRRQLGSDAVIVHTRTTRRGGFMGLGAKPVVEVTAADGTEFGQHRSQQARQQRRRELNRRRAAGGARPTGRLRATVDDRTPASPGPQQNEMAGDLIRRTYAAAKAEMEKQAPPPAPAPAPAAPAESEHSRQLAEEMKALKRMVSRMMQDQGSSRASGESKPDLPDKLFDQYLALLEQEVAEELAGEIMQQVKGQLEASEVEDQAACRQAVMQAVAGLLPADEDAEAASTGDDRPRTIALVGPTGVGKTTTIAKLAATFKLKQNKKVGLITLDTYRIAAVDQLRTYAGIIGLELEVVQSPDELKDAIARCRGCDVVLIDTAGRSQRDDPHLEELADFIDAADPHEVHLVLSSTCTQRVLLDTIERFSTIRTDRIIFTKLDEAVTFGVIINVMRTVRKRLSYVTTGQEVPHQIEPGRPERLAELVLGGGELAS